MSPEQVMVRTLQLELRASEQARRADAQARREVEDAWSRVEAEAARCQQELGMWQRGEYRYVPEVFDVDTGAVSSTTVRQPETQDSRKRGPSALAALVESSQERAKVKKEAMEDSEESDKLASQQHQYIDFLQGKIDELKRVALVAGADEYEVKRVIERQWSAV